jgi:pimeloyl-ACP methyl ester carboxylesterase
MIFDVVLEDDAKIRVRRHGSADGVRLYFSHGNGFAADAYFPYWQHLLANFDLLVFDFRNHGQNVPVVPPQHNYEQRSTPSKSAGAGMRWSCLIPPTCRRPIIRSILLWRRSRNA